MSLQRLHQCWGIHQWICQAESGQPEPGIFHVGKGKKSLQSCQSRVGDGGVVHRGRHKAQGNFNRGQG